MDEVEAKLGPIDILVNNAGISVQRGTLKLEAEAWDRVIETNFNSAFSAVANRARNRWSKRKRGKIINIASEYSRFGSRRGTFLRGGQGRRGADSPNRWRSNWRRYNIQVNAIVPGWIWTDMTIDGEEARRFMTKSSRARRPGDSAKPEEMAGAAIFLASRRVELRDRRMVYVDGGFAIR